MIRLTADGELTVQLKKRSPVLTGRAQPCTNPDCPCRVVFFFMCPPGRPDRGTFIALDVEQRAPVALQAIDPSSERDERLAPRVAAGFRDTDWDTCSRLLNEGKGDATPNPAGSFTVITPGGVIYDDLG